MNTRKTLIALTVAGLLMSGSSFATVKKDGYGFAPKDSNSTTEEAAAAQTWIFKQMNSKYGSSLTGATDGEKFNNLFNGSQQSLILKIIDDWNSAQSGVAAGDFKDLNTGNLHSVDTKPAPVAIPWTSATTPATPAPTGGNPPSPRLTAVSAGATQEQVDTAQNNALVTHAASINANTANIATNKAAIDNAYIGINNNKLQAEANKGNIAANAGQLHTLGGTVADHEQKITANKTAADGLRVDVDQNKTDITDTKTGVAGNTALIRQGQEEGFTFAGAVADKLAGLDATIEHLKDRFAALPATTQAAPVNGSLVTTATGTNTTAPTTATPTTYPTFTAATPASQTSTNTPWLKSTQNLQTKGATVTTGSGVATTTGAIQNAQALVDAGQDKAINDVTTVATHAQTTADNAVKGVVRNNQLFTAVKKEADQNKSDIQTNKTDIASVKTAEQKDRQDIDANTSKLTAVQKEADQNKADIVTAKTDIKTNTGNIATNTKNIASLKSDEQKDRHDIDANKTNIQTNSGKIATAQTKAENAFDAAVDAKTEAQSAQLKADNNHADIAALKPQVDANTQQLSTLQAYAGNAQQAIDQGDAETLAKSKDYTDSKFKQLKNQVQKAEKKANAGSASALAAVGIPGLNEGQTWNVGAGVGQYADASAVAVGANYRVSEHVAFKVGVTATPTTQNYGAFAGVSIGN